MGVTNADGELAIAIAGRLWWFWYRRGLLELGWELLETALRLSTPDLAARATALNGLASIHLALDEYARAWPATAKGWRFASSSVTRPERPCCTTWA